MREVDARPKEVPVASALRHDPRNHQSLRERGMTADRGRPVLRFDDIDAARTSQSDALVDLAEMDRSQLEALRSSYLDRLHRASDDFAATEGLRVAERALALVPRPHGSAAWQDRLRRRSRSVG
jgi:hypothetical protein